MVTIIVVADSARETANAQNEPREVKPMTRKEIIARTKGMLIEEMGLLMEKERAFATPDGLTAMTEAAHVLLSFG